MNTSNIILIVVIGLCLIVALVERLFGPRRRRRTLEEIKHDLKDGKILSTSKKYDGEIKANENGVSIEVLRKKKPSLSTATIAWSEIMNVAVYKRDLFAYDLICVFLSREDETGIEATEEMKGWEEFIKALPIQLPGCKNSEQWWRDVTLPAFATNKTEIFSRSTTSSVKAGKA